jgi:hypothetical protein
VTKPPFELQAATLLLRFIALQPAAALEQGHLRREVAAFAHLNSG